MDVEDKLPSVQIWDYRKKMFGYIMGQALGSQFAGRQGGHSRLLELELEHCYCSGAWYAVIVLACAAVESYVYFQANKKDKEAKFLAQYGLRDEWIWLTNKRKYIVHSSHHSPQNDEVIAYLYKRPDLEKDAERAITLALNVLLLGTREKLDTSITKVQNGGRSPIF